MLFRGRERLKENGFFYRLSMYNGGCRWGQKNVLLHPKLYFSAEDTFKVGGLLDSGIPLLAMNILSRIPVNIIDRFIVIFGGFFIAEGIKRLLVIKVRNEGNFSLFL
jgi:hypothetical protein